MTRPKTRDERSARLWTVADLANYMQCSESTIYKWVDEGRLPYVDLGERGRKRCIRFRPEDINHFIDDNCQDGIAAQKNESKNAANSDRVKISGRNCYNDKGSSDRLAEGRR